MKTLIIIFVDFGAKYTITVLDNLHKAFLIRRIYRAFERGKTSGRSFVIGQRNEGKRSFIDFLQHLYSFYETSKQAHTHPTSHREIVKGENKKYSREQILSGECRLLYLVVCCCKTYRVMSSL